MRRMQNVMYTVLEITTGTDLQKSSIVYPEEKPVGMRSVCAETYLIHNQFHRHIDSYV